MIDHDCMCPRCVSIRAVRQPMGEVQIMSFGSAASNTSDLKDKYILWQPGANLPPSVTFNTRVDAIKAGYIMAAKCPGKQFAVCKIVGSVKPVEDVKFYSYSE